MGKLLRVLVVVLFVLSAGALTLGIMLFNKRELLLGRTQSLEQNLRALSESFLESEPPTERDADFVRRDIDNVGPQPLDAPETSTFWETYQLHLEEQDLPKMNLGTRERTRQLMRYYVRDNIETYLLTGNPKIVTDDFGRPRTRVEEDEPYEPTLQNLLDEVLERAGGQYALLNETRQQLTDVREELVRTIEELNQTKQNLRRRLAEIVELNARIDSLQADVRRLEARERELEEEVRMKDDQIRDHEGTIAQLEDDKIQMQDRITALEEELEAMRAEEVIERIDDPVRIRLDPGLKGKVVEVNPEWNYAILELTEEAMAELGQLRVEWPPPAELLLKRPDRDDFVTKVRVVQIKRDRRLAIVNILSDWQQLPVEKGDVVFY